MEGLMPRSLVCYGVICKRTQHLVAYGYRKAEAEREAERLGEGYFVRLAAYRIKDGQLFV
jgi:hypothetical protein